MILITGLQLMQTTAMPLHQRLAADLTRAARAREDILCAHQPDAFIHQPRSLVSTVHGVLATAPSHYVSCFDAYFSPAIHRIHLAGRTFRESNDFAEQTTVAPIVAYDVVQFRWPDFVLPLFCIWSLCSEL